MTPCLARRPWTSARCARGKEKGTGKEKGKKGKGKGKPKDRDKGRDQVVNSDAEVICHHCHRTSQARLQKTTEKDKGKKGVNAVEQIPGQAAEANSGQTGVLARISMIELDDWILMVNFDDHEAQVGSVKRLVVDSGACGFSMSARIRA